VPGMLSTVRTLGGCGLLLLALSGTAPSEPAEGDERTGGRGGVGLGGGMGRRGLLKQPQSMASGGACATPKAPIRSGRGRANGSASGRRLLARGQRATGLQMLRRRRVGSPGCCCRLCREGRLLGERPHVQPGKDPERRQGDGDRQKLAHGSTAARSGRAGDRSEEPLGGERRSPNDPRNDRQVGSQRPREWRHRRRLSERPRSWWRRRLGLLSNAGRKREHGRRARKHGSRSHRDAHDHDRFVPEQARCRACRAQSACVLAANTRRTACPPDARGPQLAASVSQRPVLLPGAHSRVISCVSAERPAT
jgi:hypothetical protein